MISKIYSKPGLESLRDNFIKVAKEFETPYFSLSTINITPRNLKQISAAIDAILSEQTTAIIDSVLRESKFIIESVIKSQNEMNPLDKSLLEQLQMQLIQIYQATKQDLSKINPLANNIEILKLTVLNTLIDSPSIYSLSKLGHLRTYYDLVQSIGVLIQNTVNEVKSKFEQNHQTVQKINEFLDFYFKGVEIRAEFNRDPFNKKTINNALKLLNEIKSNDIKQVFTSYGLTQFSNLIVEIENLTEKCQSELENVKPFEIQNMINVPTKELAQVVCNAVRLYQAVIVKSSARSDLYSDAKNSKLLKEEANKLQDVCNNLLLQESFPTVKLYENVKIFLEHIESVIKNVGSEIFEKETMPAMSVIKNELYKHVNPAPPDVNDVIKYSAVLSDKIERTYQLIVSDNDSFSLEDFCQQFGKLKDEIVLVLKQISIGKHMSEYLIVSRFALASLSKTIDMFLMRENVMEFQDLMKQLNDLQIMIQNMVGLINSLEIVHFHSKEIEARSIEEVIDIDTIFIFIASQFINFSKSLAFLSNLPEFTFSPLLKYQYGLIKDKVTYLSNLSYNDPQTVIQTLDGMDLNEIHLFVKSVSPLSHNPKLSSSFTAITNNLALFKQYSDHDRLDDKSIVEYKQRIQNSGQFINDPMLRHYFNELLKSNDSLLFQQFTNSTAFILEDEIPKSFHTNLDQNTRLAMIEIYQKTLQFSSRIPHKTIFTSPFYSSNDSPLSKYAKEFYSNQSNGIDPSKVISAISETKNLPIFISSELENLKNINSTSNTLPLIRALSLFTDKSQFITCSQKMLVISFEKCKISLLNMANILQQADEKIRTDGQQHDPFLRSLLESSRKASIQWSTLTIDHAKDVISQLKNIKLVQLKLPLIYLYSSYDPSISQILNNSIMIEFFQSYIELFNSFYNMFYNYVIEFFHELENAKCCTGIQLSLISKLCQTFACSKRLTTISFIDAHDVYAEMTNYKEKIHQQVLEKITSRSLYLKVAADFALIADAMEVFDPLETLNPKIILQINSMYGFFLMSGVQSLTSIAQKKYYVDLSVSCINSMILFSKNQGMESFAQMIEYMKSMRDFIYSSDFAEKSNDYCSGTSQGFNAIIDICRREITGDDLRQFAELQRL
ncbi:hypothetical protein TVAG_251040 [Trichomonas vaginalis G3]|uniref:Uncharacterized protein n=1 Tax=Trichomonas vaginalis (strain ATCC PRA-98 / G3) TaxID=412133 RepID=A2FX29_TRIV3|nr:hypothetical protein TVAGG3_0008070 [Trichomonas vaginalis G3]EAX90533.1 hypothetical protein TVAG_251040 [Trichomonas vaginalis G3]KAI5539022.1 hypothetical protein TVAGG3_0008070 [Trichomonas vaginalis G3]|eukprot:XP_001303463.1 hypothetical protein [Trichomonas vaginalis G3]